jgi:RNA polymerase sigma factor (sigma-70 family)
MRRAKHDDGIESLARRMSALEDEAYEEFSDMFGPRIKGYLILHGLTPTDAEDLTGSWITDIALKVDKYREIEGAGFTAWVFTLVRHALADWQRSRKAALPYIDDIESENLIDDADPEPNVEVIVSVREALAALGEVDQTILDLRYFGVEHSFVEIGKRLGIRPNTVRVRHHRALEKVKAMLETDPRLSTILERAGLRSEGA